MRSMTSETEKVCQTICKSEAATSRGFAGVLERVRWWSQDFEYYPSRVTTPAGYCLTLARKATQEINSNRSPRECHIVRAAAIEVYMEFTSVADGENLMTQLGM
jgi:hypothetical protein